MSLESNSLLTICIQNVEDAAETIDIANCFVGGLHIVDVDDFWRHESRCSATAVEVDFFVHESSKTEISEDDR